MSEQEKKELDSLLASERIDTETAPAWFHEKQNEAFESTAKIIGVIAGWQSGKTVTGPPWLLREIQRKGPGDYAIVAPTLKLMKKKVLPEFRATFVKKHQLGTYHQTDHIFTFSEEGMRKVFGQTNAEPVQIFFGYAEDPNSLESATYKGVWADEPGMDSFKEESHECLVSRVLIHAGRILYTSRPYNLGWYKSKINDLHDRVKVHVINFATADNPAMQGEEQKEELAEIERTMPAWKFDMKYRGLFTRPLGAIYDCFDADNKVQRFDVFDGSQPPKEWAIFTGTDFGNVNTATVLIAEERVQIGPSIWGDPTGRYIIFGTYVPGTTQSVYEHMLGVKDIAAYRRPAKAYGGSHQEAGWREAAQVRGWNIQEPDVNDVETQINRVYAAFASKMLVVCDDLGHMISEIERYSRKLDENDEPTEEIENKAKFHRCDALRYIASQLFKEKPKRGDANVYSVSGGKQ